MAKTFITSGTGASQTLDTIQNEKVPVYNTRADAEADLANIEEGGIVATKDTGATEKVVNVVEDGNMNPVTSNGVYDAMPKWLELNGPATSGERIASRWSIIDFGNYCLCFGWNREAFNAAGGYSYALALPDGYTLDSVVTANYFLTGNTGFATGTVHNYGTTGVTAYVNQSGQVGGSSFRVVCTATKN